MIYQYLNDVYHIYTYFVYVVQGMMSEIYIYIYNLFCHMYVLIILIECINAAPFILATQEKLLFPCTVSRNHGNRSLNLSYRTCVLLILYLVGGLEHVLFFHILEIVIPTDFHIFERGRYTTNQI